MITPEEIRKKAKNLYPRLVAAWLSGQELFPYMLRANLKPSPDYIEAKNEQLALRRA